MAWLADFFGGRFSHWNATQGALSKEMILTAITFPATDFRNWLIAFLNATNSWLKSFFFDDNPLYLKEFRPRLNYLTTDSFRNLHAIMLCWALTASKDNFPQGDWFEAIEMVSDVLKVPEESLQERLDRYESEREI